MPKVSIVMPVYNGEAYIKEAIDSIISQTFTDWEFIIVNEYGSNETVTNILHDYEKKDSRIHVIQNQTRLRIAESLNVGLRAAKGEYIARMDADDISGKDRLLNQVKYLDEHQEIDICGMKIDMFGESTWDWKVYSNPDYLKCSCLFYTPFIHPTIMMRTSSIRKYNLEYDKTFFYTEDYEFFERASHFLNYTNLEIPKSYYYRYLSTNATNVGGNQGLQLQNKVMKSAFERWGLNFTNDDIRILSPNTYPYALSIDEAQDLLEKLDILLKEVFLCDKLRDKFGIEILFEVLHRRWLDAYEAVRWRPEIMEDGQIQRAIDRGFFNREKFYKSNFVSNGNKPRVSVVIPTYNSENYIMDTLWSILEQDYDNFEILIMNEKGSDDRTKKCVNLFKDSRIKFIQNETRLGLAKSLNKGFHMSQGEYIARADADDVYPKERLRKQVNFLDNNKEIDVCGSWQRHFGKRNYIHKPPTTKEELRANLLFKCEVCHSTVMLRKDKFISLDVIYDDNYLSEDYELWSRVSNNMWFATIPEVLGEYRWNGDNITAKKMDMLDIEAQKIVRRNLHTALGIDISDKDLILLSGWKNPFIGDGDDKEELRKREDILLKQIEEKNNIVNAIDSKALLKLLDERRIWAGIKKENIIKKVSDVISDNMENDNSGGICRKMFKKILKPLYKPFRTRYENRLIGIQESVWRHDGILNEIEKNLHDTDGHLYDYYNFLKIKIEKQDAYIDQLQKTLELVTDTIQVLKSELVTCVQSTERKIDVNVDARVSKAEQLINQTVDERVWKAEKLINQTIDERVWKAEKLINQTVDERVWKAEQLINQTVDERVWKAEKLINQTVDERAWKAEKLINQTIDERVWKAEKLINQTIDGRVWKAEENILKTIEDRTDAQLWNILFQFGKNQSNLVQDTNCYDYIFYLNNRYHSAISAQHILAPLFKVLKHNSVVDFGCGTGTWLWVASQLGCGDIVGYDGDYVPRNLLMIEENSFVPVDLSKSLPQEKHYDLAISMEVGEHLPESSADIFVDNICRHSDTILFSAAHPGQGGDEHINEQPIEYWIKKFEQNGYNTIEIKKYFENDTKIESWYRQNMVLFVRNQDKDMIKIQLEEIFS